MLRPGIYIPPFLLLYYIFIIIIICHPYLHTSSCNNLLQLSSPRYSSDSIPLPKRLTLPYRPWILSVQEPQVHPAPTVKTSINFLGVLVYFALLYAVLHKLAQTLGLCKTNDKAKPQEPVKPTTQQDNNNHSASSALSISKPIKPLVDHSSNENNNHLISSANPDIAGEDPDLELQYLLEYRLGAQMKKIISSLGDLDELPFDVFWDEDSGTFQERHKNDLQTLAVLQKIDTKCRALKVETKVKEAAQGKEA